MTSESSWLRFRFGEQLDQWHYFKLLFVWTVLEEEEAKREQQFAHSWKDGRIEERWMM
jgi:hypothetical protein